MLGIFFVCLNDFFIYIGVIGYVVVYVNELKGWCEVWGLVGVFGVVVLLIWIEV